MKYKITSEPVQRQGDYGPYKLVDLVGPAGETFSGVLVGSRVAAYKNCFLGGEIDGVIDSSGKYPKFTVPKENAWANKPNRDYAAEEEARSKRIAFLACTERAIELLAILNPKTAPDMNDAEVRKFIFDWRSWFIEQYNQFTK